MRIIRGNTMTTLNERLISKIYVPPIVTSGMLRFAEVFDSIVGYTSTFALPLGILSNIFL